MLNKLNKLNELKTKQMKPVNKLNKVKFLNKSYRINTLLSALILSSLAGCQSLPITATNKATNGSKVSNEMAKDKLSKSLNSLPYHAFAYETTIKLSNANRRHALANATIEQLNAAENPNEHCEKVHDTAYQALLNQAIENGADINELENQIEAGITNDYSDKLEAIKQDYINCYTAYHTWKQANTRFEKIELGKQVNKSLLQNDDSLLTDIEAKKELQDELAMLEQTQIDEKLTADDIKQLTPKYLLDYDSDHSKLDRKKSELFNAYALQPTTGKITGVYQPLVGRFTMLPMLNYQARNLNLSINQPLYIDIHRGELYIWADNFAMTISQNFDDKLGLAWKDKWLKLSLDDGSLPKGFAKYFIKSYLDAQKMALKKEKTDNFTYINPVNKNTLISLNETKHSSSLDNIITGKHLSQTNYVIQQQQNQYDVDKSLQIFSQYLHDSIYKKYPELLPEDDKELENEQNETQSKKLTSRFFITSYLSYLQKQANKTIDVDDGMNSNAGVNNQNSKVLQQYGFNNNGKLLWWRYQIRLPSNLDSPSASDEGSVVTALTQFYPVSQHGTLYPALPNDMQMPNASNTVELKDYIDELEQRYQQDEGVALGSMIFQSLW